MHKNFPFGNKALLSNIIYCNALFEFQTKSTYLLQLALKRHTETAVRSVHHVQRIAEQLKNALTGTETEGEPPTCILVLSNGYFSTSTGEGSLYEEFRKSKKLGHYIGKNVYEKTHDDVDYSKSRLRHMPFDRAFTHCNTDAKDCKFLIGIIY